MRYAILFYFILGVLTTKGIDNNLYIPYHYSKLRSIQFYNTSNKLNYPIYKMGSEGNLQLDFDILGSENIALRYRIIHCKANGITSNLQVSKYLSSINNEFYLENYDISVATDTIYTHYSLKIPNESFNIKLSGNYLIQVYDQDNPDEILLQEHFFYVEDIAQIEGKIEYVTASQYFDSHQRVNFNVTYESKLLKEVRTSIKAVVMQNFRIDDSNMQIINPLFVTNNQLRFNYINKKGRFAGNYEFPYFDTSNISTETNTVRTIERDKKGEIHCYLYPQEKTKFYSSNMDMNGNYTIKADNLFNLDTEANYAWVHFTLVTHKLPSEVYVLGRFNQWQMSPEYLMKYNKELNAYHLKILLKQGVYNYTFTAKETSKGYLDLMGSFKETENDYYIFIYYNDYRLRYDRLIGWRRINSREM